MKTELNNNEKDLLKIIMIDKYAKGPFVGMIFNKHIETGKSVDELTKMALATRLMIEDMAELGLPSL